MKTYECKKIVSIAESFLNYLNEKNELTKIDLDACRKNWINYVNEKGDFIDWDGNPVKYNNDNETNCVGVRDWFEEKPYFEFFTEEKIRFEIQIPSNFFINFFKKARIENRQKYYSEFRRIETMLKESGWSTFDNG